jgi:hypothetical protein
VQIRQALPVCFEGANRHLLIPHDYLHEERNGGKDAQGGGGQHQEKHPQKRKKQTNKNQKKQKINMMTSSTNFIARTSQKKRLWRKQLHFDAGGGKRSTVGKEARGQKLSSGMRIKETILHHFSRATRKYKFFFFFF